MQLVHTRLEYTGKEKILAQCPAIGASPLEIAGFVASLREWSGIPCETIPILRVSRNPRENDQRYGGVRSGQHHRGFIQSVDELVEVLVDGHDFLRLTGPHADLREVKLIHDGAQDA